VSERTVPKEFNDANIRRAREFKVASLWRQKSLTESGRAARRTGQCPSRRRHSERAGFGFRAPTSNAPAAISESWRGHRAGRRYRIKFNLMGVGGFELTSLAGNRLNARRSPSEIA
jgi:hypothetical protein